MSTKSNKAKKATKAKMATALGKQRNIQAMRAAKAPRDALSQKQMSTQIPELDDARECELEYLAAKLDPFNAKSNPCSLGYKNIPSIVVKKELRFQMKTTKHKDAIPALNGKPAAAPEELGGYGWVALNPYLAMSEDLPAVAYSNGAATPVTAAQWQLTGAVQVPVVGGVFTGADLATAEAQPGFVAGRVITAAIRFKPMGAAINTQGLTIGRQITNGGDAIGTTLQYPTAVVVADALTDLTKPIFNITNDGEWTTLNWNNLTVPEGDLISHELFAKDLDTIGASLWLGVAGCADEYPFLCEVVVICEYVSLKKALGLSKPSHQNQQVASWIDSVIQSVPSYHGAPVSLLYAGAAKLGQYMGLSEPVMARKVIDKIKDDGSWAHALGAGLAGAASAYFA
jgi:hypothetical protein